MLESPSGCRKASQVLCSQPAVVINLLRTKLSLFCLEKIYLHFSLFSKFMMSRKEQNMTF